MAKHYQEAEYFVPILTPYVQWVRAYKELIFSLYGEHKTVRRTWKAFKDAVPGVEQRLEFGVFEQILLFSLFLSEWNEGGEQRPPSSREPQENTQAPDGVIQELRNVSEERDRALWNIRHLEENAEKFLAQKENLENRVKSLEMDLGELEKKLGISADNLLRVIHELDAQKEENARLRLKRTASMKKQTSLKHQVKELREKLDSHTAAGVKAGQPAEAGDGPRVRQGPSQMVIEWVGRGAGQGPAGKIVQHSETGTCPAKIGRWNAQRSKDGYYRLYRKIGGRVHSIYIGKELDIDKAVKRIAEKEKELSGMNTAGGP
jgi:chaperonin cofactor prefoldin